MSQELTNNSEFLFYTSTEGKIKVQVIADGTTVWASQKGMSDIFGTVRENVTIHLNNIFNDKELLESSVCKEILHTATDGKKYKTRFYNLDAIISVGYRINSYQATQFRKWATSILNEYLIKGFTLDDERLKQSHTMFGVDYFQELLERIREIRASERRFYQKITDIYAQCSIDYDPSSPISQTFFAIVQNKLEYAITHKTAGELVKSRANYLQPNMGLSTWKNAPHGKISKSDISVAKNYLNKEELSELNAVVNMYLDYAELQANRNKTMKMSDWIERMDSFLTFNEYDLLKNSGSITAKVAKIFAEKQFEKFRIIQDKNFQSDFDKLSIRSLQSKNLLKYMSKKSPIVPTFNGLEANEPRTESPSKLESGDSEFDAKVNKAIKKGKPKN